MVRIPKGIPKGSCQQHFSTLLTWSRQWHSQAKQKLPWAWIQTELGPSFFQIPLQSVSMSNTLPGNWAHLCEQKLFSPAVLFQKAPGRSRRWNLWYSSIKITWRGVLGNPDSPAADGSVAHFLYACIQPTLAIMRFNQESFLCTSSVAFFFKERRCVSQVFFSILAGILCNKPFWPAPHFLRTSGASSSRLLLLSLSPFLRTTTRVCWFPGQD